MLVVLDHVPGDRNSTGWNTNADQIRDALNRCGEARPCPPVTFLMTSSGQGQPSMLGWEKGQKELTKYQGLVVLLEDGLEYPPDYIERARRAVQHADQKTGQKVMVALNGIVLCQALRRRLSTAGPGLGPGSDVTDIPPQSKGGWWTGVPRALGAVAFTGPAARWDVLRNFVWLVLKAPEQRPFLASFKFVCFKYIFVLLSIIRSI